MDENMKGRHLYNMKKINNINVINNLPDQNVQEQFPLNHCVFQTLLYQEAKQVYLFHN